MEDIASLAGVSTMTVSRILAGKAKGKRADSVARTKRVRQLADSLGYRPNMAAQATKSGRFNSLALIIGGARKDDSFGWLPYLMLSGINRAAHDLEFMISIAEMSDDELTNVESMPRLLRDRCSDGLLVNYIMDMPLRLVDLIHRLKIPTVWTNVKLEHDAVHPDDVRAGFLATEHLLRMGHRKIGYVGWWRYGLGGHYSQIDRLRGYEMAMKSAGLEPKSVLLDDEELETRPIGAAGQWLKQLDNPTGVVVYKSVDAVKLHIWVGHQVPKQLSIVTFADEGGRAIDAIPFTSVDIPFGKMGKAAVEMLIKKITTRDPSPVPSLVLEPALFAGSTAIPPSQ